MSPAQTNVRSMFDRVAVPLDGSELALRAIGPARRIARSHDAQLVLITVATPETGGTTRATNVLAAARRVAGTDVDALTIEAHDAARALAEFDADHPATLLCMTTRGRGALRRKLIGGTALDVVRHSPHAVVLVGPRCDPDLDTPIDPIIVCLDGTIASEVAVPWATRWGQRTHAGVVLMHVVYPVAPPEARVPPSRQLLEQLDYLPRLVKQLRSEYPKIRHVTIPGTDPTLAIQEASDGYANAMFAIATSHPGPVSDLLLGSTASHVIRTANVPVLVVSKTDTADPPPIQLPTAER
jgi:nucleotide-binding universal stress UspA family protein